MPQVTISLVGHNNKNYLPYCLRSILNQSFTDIELFYLDSGSTDKSAEFVRQDFPTVKIIAEPKNIHYAAAHNKIISQSTSPYVLILNPDLILDRYFLERLLQTIDSNPKIAAVNGKLFKWDFKNQQKTGQLDSVGLEIFKNHRVIDRGVGESSEKFNQTEPIFGATGAAVLLRRRALDHIKLNDQYFAEDFVAYKEDLDLSFRLRHRGWQIYYTPQALAYHDRWATGSSKSSSGAIQNRAQKNPRVNQLSYQNHLRAILRNEPTINLLRCAPSLGWYELQKFVYVLAKERKTLKGFSQFLKSLPLTIKARRAILASSKIEPKVLRQWLK